MPRHTSARKTWWATYSRWLTPKGTESQAGEKECATMRVDKPCRAHAGNGCPPTGLDHGLCGGRVPPSGAYGLCLSTKRHAMVSPGKELFCNAKGVPL